MKVIGLELREAQMARYKKFLDEAGEGLFQTPAWGAVKAEEGWRPWCLVATSDAEIRGGLIALERRAGGPLGGLWHVPRGPVARLDTVEGREAGAALLVALSDLAVKRGGISIRISPDVGAGTLPAGWLASLGYAPVSDAPWLHTATFRVDLAREEEAILAGMEGRTRSAIRKAVAAGVAVDMANTQACFEAFHRMLRATGERNDFRVVPEARMRALWERSRAEGWGCVFLSRARDGEPLTGALVLAPGRRCHYLFGGSLPACRKLHPNELLHWEVMRWARARGCAVYDLQGVAGRIRPDHPLWGNYLFKRGFGGEYVELEGEFERVLRPRFDRALKWGLARVRAAASLARRSETHG